MTPQPHPDLLQAQQAAKSITRGSKQAADTAAMEAFWLALDEGKSRDEAGEIFIKTYQKFVHGK